MESNERIIFVADGLIDFTVQNNLEFTVFGDSLIDSRVGLAVLSTHPYAAIHMETTDFLTGAVVFSAPEIDVFGERGLNFHLQDDDDANPVGTYQITAPFISFEAQNSGLIESNAGGDVVISAPWVHVHAGDDFYALVNQQFEINVPEFYINTVTPISFTSPNNILQQSTTSTTTYQVAGDILVFCPNGETEISGESVSMASGQLGAPKQTTSFISNFGFNIFTFDTLIATENYRSVDIVDGMILPILTDFDDNYYYFSYENCGNIGEFFYEADTLQFCYCTTEGYYLCNAVIEAYFNY